MEKKDHTTEYVQACWDEIEAKTRKQLKNDSKNLDPEQVKEMEAIIQTLWDEFEASRLPEEEPEEKKLPYVILLAGKCLIAGPEILPENGKFSLCKEDGRLKLNYKKQIRAKKKKKQKQKEDPEKVFLISEDLKIHEFFEPEAELPEDFYTDSFVFDISSDLDRDQIFVTVLTRFYKEKEEKYQKKQEFRFGYSH